MDDMRMRQQMEFIVEHQAQFSIDMAQLKGEMAELKGIVTDLARAVTRLEAQAESDRAETREAINNLVIANEVTRKLTEDVARLAMQTSHRVTWLESKQ
jgi:hypothetical protein